MAKSALKIAGHYERTNDPSEKLELRVYDQRLLDWFFGYGQTIFYQSTYGDMVDRAHFFMYGEGRKCALCKGAGFTDFKPNTTCPGCTGLGHTPKRIPNSDPDTWTARPHGHPFEEPSYTPDHDDLSRFGEATRMLSRVGAKDPESAEVLAAYWGNSGARWGATNKGRLFAVYPLTHSGARMIHQSLAKLQDESRLPPAEILGVEAELQRSQPKAERAKAFEAARVQSIALYNRAVAAWESVR
jgi:hypothetical protein